MYFGRVLIVIYLSKVNNLEISTAPSGSIDKIVLCLCVFLRVCLVCDDITDGCQAEQTNIYVQNIKCVFCAIFMNPERKRKKGRCFTIHCTNCMQIHGGTCLVSMSNDSLHHHFKVYLAQNSRQRRAKLSRNQTFIGLNTLSVLLNTLCVHFRCRNCVCVC